MRSRRGSSPSSSFLVQDSGRFPPFRVVCTPSLSTYNTLSRCLLVVVCRRRRSDQVGAGEEVYDGPQGLLTCEVERYF